MATADLPFAALLKRHRLAAGLTQETLAERSGLSARAVSDLERDNSRTPRLETVELLAAALALSPEHRAGLFAAARPVVGPTVFSPTITHPPDPLPAPPTPLLGREREVVAVRMLLGSEETRMVTLTGPGGVGKTRLALQVATELGEAFPDGVFWVELAALSDPALVLPTAARALGVQEAAGPSLAARLAHVLRERRLLLVLDNFEQVLAAAPDVAEVLTACSKLTILATSRAPLRLRSEREFPVPPLGLPTADRQPSLAEASCSGAVRLFAERARAARPDFLLDASNAPAVTAICRRLDGLPLAIELAAARIRTLPPSALLARLDRRLMLLGDGPQDLPARQRTVRATIDWSHDLLGMDERTLFARLAVFAGGWTLSAAEAVCGGAGGAREEAGVLVLLSRLVEQSLLVAEEAAGDIRYRMLKTLGDYASEHLDASGEAGDIRRRHGEYFLALAEEARELLTGSDQGVWLKALEAEHANLRAALEWFGSHGHDEAALRLVGALGLPWFTRGRAAEGRALAGPLLAATAATGPTVARAKALSAAAFWSYALAGPAEMGEARALYKEALAVWRELGDEHAVARTLNHLAVAEFYANDNETARVLIEASLPVLRRDGDGFLVASSLRILGSIAWREGRDPEAEAYFNESIAIARRRHDLAGLADTLYSSGELLHERGELGAARSRYQEALAIMRELDERNGLTYVLDALGGVALAQGEYASARAAFDEVLRLLTELDYTVNLSRMLESYACLAVAEEQPARALRLAGAAVTLSENFGTTRQERWQDDLPRQVDAARQTLGAAAATAWAEGRAMSPEQAVSYALTPEELA